MNKICMKNTDNFNKLKNIWKKWCVPFLNIPLDIKFWNEKLKNNNKYSYYYQYKMLKSQCCKLL
jgi:hypothetical protein